MRIVRVSSALALVLVALATGQACVQGGATQDEGCVPCTPGCRCDAGTGDGASDAPQDTFVPKSCGDGECKGDETCATCPADCGACPNPCGNGSCTGWKDCKSCPGDCGPCTPTCGDGKGCVPPKTCKTCPSECGVCPSVCGDGACDATKEDCVTCPGDCGACVCGDGKGCVAPKTCKTCPTECGVCPPTCGDGTGCVKPKTCATCPGDCGACPVCGDGVCNGTDKCSTCAGDCPCEFKLVVKAGGIGNGWYAVQCKPGGTRRDVWMSSASTGGPAWSSTYSFKYDEPTSGCPAPTSGHYPIVFTTNNDVPALGSWVIQCTDKPGFAYVFRVATKTGTLPTATFQYPQDGTAECL